MSDTIDSLADEAFKALFADVSARGEAGEGDPAPDPVPEPVAKSEAAKPDDAGKDQPQFISRALRRISERERAVAAKERELAQKSQEKPSWTKASIRADLGKYLREELGIDPAHAGRALMSEVLGDKSPEEYRRIAAQMRDGAKSEGEMESLRAEVLRLREQVEARSASAEMQKYQDDYFASIDKYVSGDLTSSPRAAALIAKNRTRALSEIRRLVGEDARAKLASGEAANPLTPAEAISALEQYLADFMDAPTAKAVPAGTPDARKTLTSPSHVPSPPKSGSLDDLIREADDWLMKQRV